MNQPELAWRSTAVQQLVLYGGPKTARGPVRAISQKGPLTWYFVGVGGRI